MEKLTVCFMIYGLYAEDGRDFYDDVDRIFREAKERGFNCVRFDDGAGLLCDPDGRARGPVTIRPPFGKYTHVVRQSDPIARVMRVDVCARLLKIFAAAKKHGLKLIPSSWYYLHTNWLTDDAINRELFGLPTERKIAYFGEELDRVLTLARENGYIDRIAFAEIFNEFDGLPFAGEYKNDLSAEENAHLRACHEAAVDRLRAHHPDVKFGYDSASAYSDTGMMPRNVDVWNCHSYYLWPIYEKNFEGNVVCRSLEEIPYSEKTRAYLREDRTKVGDVAREMGGAVRTGGDWPRRIALYSSIADEKMPALEDLLEKAMIAEGEDYFAGLARAVDHAVGRRDALLPGADLVLGEGVTYCASNYLHWEEHSDRYWEMLLRQAALLRDKGFSGTVVRTTACPEDPSWDCRADDMKKVNEMFLGK